MFSSIFQSLKKIYVQLITPLQKFFARTTINKQDLEQLRIMLLEADLGVRATDRLMKRLDESGASLSGENARSILRTELLKILNQVPVIGEDTESIIMLVGINGSGKTTCAAKLAYSIRAKGKRPLLVAADTFRAAATEQLTQWASKYEFDVESGKQGQDPASVVFAGCTKFRSGLYDELIVDTAGRLQTKTNLMEELAKMRRVVSKQFPDKKIVTLLTVDSMLGQNSLEQARMFREHVPLDGIILTKLDGTGKGGVVFAITEQLQLPVYYVATGERIDQLQAFDAAAFVDMLVGA